jgi:glycosyltransferase involved in cell wall biosynthesis
MSKKVLIITYYWPPSGGSGVQRWLKFVKYLPQFGWEPYVFTPQNPSFPMKDESLFRDIPSEAEVIHFPIWEPYEAFNRLSSAIGEKKGNPAELVSKKKKSFFQKLSTWIRANLFIPDPRVFWVKPSAAFLNDFLRDNKITTIITTGPPHSVHLIGYRLKKRNPSLRWIADFRDPWSEWGFLESIQVGSLAMAWHRKLEANVLASADAIITVTPSWVKMFEALSGRKVTLLTNGYDEADFSDLRTERPARFTLRHVGIVNERCNPVPFMEAVHQLCVESEEFRQNTDIEFIGEVYPVFKQYVMDHPTLAPITKFVPTVPHSALISRLGSTSVLLLILTGYKDPEGYLPGKLFEYLATGLPILGIGPVNGDASALLRTTGNSQMIDSDDTTAIKSVLLNHFEHWKTSNTPPVTPSGTSSYSRRSLTAQLVEILE